MNPEHVDAPATGDSPSLALIVGAARSGTTLLRLLLDRHPEIGAPAEAGIPALLGHLCNVWTIVGETMQSEPHELPAEFRREIAAAAIAPMRHYCMAHGKRIYVDKSLDSVHFLPVVRTFVPEGRYILLFRHVMDCVASGLEASPWGFQAYGYAPFVNVTNFVAGLVAHWRDHVGAALQWEAENPGQCLRVTYESLVTRPDDVLQMLCRFLEVDATADLLRGPLDNRPHPGPGDHKVHETRTVHMRSIGRGKTVPVGLIPRPLLDATNQMLSELGYDALDESWNTTVRSRTSAPSLGSTLGAAVVAADGVRSESDPFVVAADDSGASWIVDPRAGTVRAGAASELPLVMGDTCDLVAAITSEVAVAVLMRAGRLRYRGAAETASTEWRNGDRAFQSIEHLQRAWRSREPSGWPQGAKTSPREQGAGQAELVRE